MRKKTRRLPCTARRISPQEGLETGARIFRKSAPWRAVVRHRLGWAVDGLPDELDVRDEASRRPPRDAAPGGPERCGAASRSRQDARAQEAAIQGSAARLRRAAVTGVARARGARQAAPSVSAASRIQAPFLAIVNGDDPRMPEPVVRRIVDAHAGIHRLWVASGVDHVGAIYHRDWRNVVLGFLDDHQASSSRANLPASSEETGMPPKRAR